MSGESPNGSTSARGATMRVFILDLFLILLCLQGMQVKATETISTDQESEMEKEADTIARKEVWTKAKIRREDPRSPLRQQATAAASRRYRLA